MGASHSGYIAVCGSGGSGLPALLQVLESTGSSQVIQIRWPDLPEIDVLNRVELFVATTNGDGLPEGLAQFLRTRGNAPLIVIGRNPVHMANPTLWLPSAPRADLLVAIVKQFVREERPEARV